MWISAKSWRELELKKEYGDFVDWDSKASCQCKGKFAETEVN